MAIREANSVRPRLLEAFSTALLYCKRFRLHFLLLGNFALLMLATAFEGLGLAMLIPILQVMGGEQEGNIFMDYVKYLFSVFGVEMNVLSLLLLFGTLMLTKYLLVFSQRYVTRLLSSRVIYELRQESFENMMRVYLGFYYRVPVGDLVATQYTSSQNAGGLVEYVLLMSKAITFCALYLVINSLISLPLTLITCGVGAILGVFLLGRFHRGFDQGTEEKRLTDLIYSYLYDVLGGIKLVKALGREREHIDGYRRMTRSFRDLQVHMTANRILSSAILEPVLFVAIMVITIVAVVVLNVLVASIITFVFVWSQLLPNLRVIVESSVHINELLPHVHKIERIIETRDKVYLPRGTEPVVEVRKGIRFENVFFAYPNTDRMVLDGLNLLIEKNRVTALVGPSGGGKTTIADLILRLHDPTQGQVLVDGIDLSTLKVDDWRRLVGIVDQDAFLFNDTIYNNVAYGKEDATGDDVVNAARMANAHQFILDLPHGYQTRIGNRGMTLSGGQRQRIALARALIKNPQVLVLDEATSALDSESEELIHQAILRLHGSKTIIVIAHRLSTIRIADQIALIGNGRVTEEGSHDLLVAQGGRYSAYHRLQSESREPHPVPTSRDAMGVEKPL